MGNKASAGCGCFRERGSEPETILVEDRVQAQPKRVSFLSLSLV